VKINISQILKLSPAPNELGYGAIKIIITYATAH
jgi:hypothetical protein